jgi:hypothetical protein
MRLRPLLPVVLSAASLLSAGCASAPTSGPRRALPPGVERIEPGETIEFEGRVFQMRQVQEDFVLLRYREPAGVGGGISGFVDEVFRVCRYDLGEGRWYTHAKLPDVYLQWLGLDSFAMAHDRSALRGAEVVMLR